MTGQWGGRHSNLNKSSPGTEGKISGSRAPADFLTEHITLNTFLTKASSRSQAGVKFLPLWQDCIKTLSCFCFRPHLLLDRTRSEFGLKFCLWSLYLIVVTVFHWSWEGYERECGCSADLTCPQACSPWKKESNCLVKTTNFSKIKNRSQNRSGGHGVGVKLRHSDACKILFRQPANHLLKSVLGNENLETYCSVLLLVGGKL